MQAKWSRDQVTVVTVIALALMTVAAIVDPPPASTSDSAATSKTCFVDGMDVLSGFIEAWYNPHSVRYC